MQLLPDGTYEKDLTESWRVLVALSNWRVKRASFRHKRWLAWLNHGHREFMDGFVKKMQAGAVVQRFPGSWLWTASSEWQKVVMSRLTRRQRRFYKFVQPRLAASLLPPGSVVVTGDELVDFKVEFSLSRKPSHESQ